MMKIINPDNYYVCGLSVCSVNIGRAEKFARKWVCLRLNNYLRLPKLWALLSVNPEKFHDLIIKNLREDYFEGFAKG